MSIASVVTQGFGPGASIPLVVTKGYLPSEAVAPAEPVAPPAQVATAGPGRFYGSSFSGIEWIDLVSTRGFARTSALLIEIVPERQPEPLPEPKPEPVVVHLVRMQPTRGRSRTSAFAITKDDSEELMTVIKIAAGLQSIERMKRRA